MDKMLTEDNAVISMKNASVGKRKQKGVKRVINNPEEWIDYYLNYAEHYKNHKHNPVEIYDGICMKKRTIIVPHYDEQVIHHMVINVLQPIFMKSMYEHVYGSIPGRGSHKARKYIEKWIREDPKNCKYCLKMDIKHFFDSIPHGILMYKLSNLIKDKKFLYLLQTIISVQDNGLPLGFYTSQWFANWYLSDLDHFIKEILGAVHYVRYMDDMIIFGSNKKKLHYMRECIETYLEGSLGLELKGNWQVFRFDYIKKGEHYGRCLDFVGFKFYRDKVVLRKSIMLKMTRKANKISKKERMTLHDAQQMLSYLGWIDCTDTYDMYRKWIKPKITFGECILKVRTHDRYINNHKEENEDDNEFWKLPIYSHAKAS